METYVLFLVDLALKECDNLSMGTRGFDRSVLWRIASRGVITLVKMVANNN